MDVTTAGIALILTEFLVALVMTGACYAIPKEKCIRYWAISRCLLAFGVAIIAINNGAPNLILRLIGNSMIIVALIFQWWGLQLFYTNKYSRWGWGLAFGFFVAFNIALLGGASPEIRSILAGGTIIAILALCSVEICTNQKHGLSFAAYLLMGAFVLTTITCLYLPFAIFQVPDTLPPTNTHGPGIFIIYMLPLASGLLITTGLLLLFFENLVETKHYLATHDELTGLLNRREIIAAGERELAAAVQQGHAVTVAYIDVDYFKRINDGLGHAVGDSVLSRLGKILRNECRPIDLIGRYGGEEFCIVFPGMDKNAAHKIGDRLVRAVRERGAELPSEVTISVGIAVLAPNETERSWNGLIRQADIQLYQAKNSGRDRFCIA